LFTVISINCNPSHHPINITREEAEASIILRHRTKIIGGKHGRAFRCSARGTARTESKRGKQRGEKERKKERGKEGRKEEKGKEETPVSAVTDCREASQSVATDRFSDSKKGRSIRTFITFDVTSKGDRARDLAVSR